MLIFEIQLTNIGPFRGVNTFNLRPEKEKNVILIGGENGAGKTTLLNAIKIGLFGSYAYGYKSDNAEYLKIVQSLLNNNAKKSAENNFQIKLDFSLVDNFEKIEYTLYRQWKYTSTSFKESVEIIANGKHYSDYDKDVFQSKLKEIMPPQLLDLCLFDGEEISRIVSEDLLSSYLKNLSKVVFNLDLFETMENDLENYASQSLDVDKMNSMEKELYSLNIREKELKNSIASTLSLINELTIKKQDHVNEYQRIKNDFEQYGGLIKTEREEILSKIHDLEVIRKQNMEKVKEYVANFLPFFLSNDLLTQTRNQIKNEEQFQLYRQMDSKLSDEALSSLLKKVPGSFETNTSSVLKEQLLSLMKPQEEIIQIHGASFSESSLIENMFLNVSSDINKSNLARIKENQTLLKELQELKQKLNKNDTTSEFSEMIQKMEDLKNSTINIDEELHKDQEKLISYQNELQDLTHSIDRIQKSLKDNEKTKSSFLESQKVITLSRRFRELQNKKKLQQVQIEATIMLKKIFRKQNYISYVRIDHETYDVHLYDSQKEHIEKRTLSAGEKEMLLIALIWSIFKCSGRKVPFIFDTLLGRLDKTHKSALLTEFIPNFGEQVIILATDSEIDEQHYKLLVNHVAKEYMLDFNVEKQETNILNQYFSFNNMELNI